MQIRAKVRVFKPKVYMAKEPTTFTDALSQPHWKSYMIDDF